ncbi:MAG TPA: hypothetical protein VL982_11550, partial [Burkholderiales bacterium]|nr:hypothetical protein [Burkholderiales bacterium]
MDYSSYQDLKVRSLEPGILEIVMGEEGKLAVATARAHAEMARVWLDVDRDPETRVAILRGAGKGFSAGGDAEPRVAIDDPRGPRCDRDVGKQAHDQPGADGRPVHRGDDHLRAVDDVVD